MAFALYRKSNSLIIFIRHWTNSFQKQRGYVTVRQANSLPQSQCAAPLVVAYLADKPIARAPKASSPMCRVSRLSFNPHLMSWEERSVGKECESTGKFSWSPYH